MIKAEIVRAVLKTLFWHKDHVSMYEVIDDDMIRKSAIEVIKRKGYENVDNEYFVRINWRLLDKFISEGSKDETQE